MGSDAVGLSSQQLSESDRVIAGAAVDVYAKEPTTSDNPLTQCEGVINTPHIGASSQEAQVNCAVAAAEHVIAYFDKGEVVNKVN